MSELFCGTSTDAGHLIVNVVDCHFGLPLGWAEECVLSSDRIRFEYYRCVIYLEISRNYSMSPLTILVGMIAWSEYVFFKAGENSLRFLGLSWVLRV